LSNPGNKLMELKSEFAGVVVELDKLGNGPRLMIRDIRTGKTNYLDPLELEALAWVSHDQLEPFLNPSITRWVEQGSAMSDFERWLREQGVEMQP